MPFLEHLDQLRWRLLKSMIAVVITSIVAFTFSDQLFGLIVAPLEGKQLQAIDVTGEFYAFLKVSLITGVFAAVPIIFYQLWAFVSPGLYAEEKGSIIPLVIISSLLFLLGAGFCWWVVLPLSLTYLIGFSDGLILSQPTIGSYISFAGTLLIAFGLGFEMPVAAFFLGKIGILKSNFMCRGRRYAIVAILIVAAILTPADIFSQVMLAGPLYILYEISILLVKSIERGKARKAAALEAEEANENNDNNENSDNEFPMN